MRLPIQALGPKAKVLLVLILICAGLCLTIVGCAKKPPAPAVPMEVAAMDMPYDNGTNAIISWRHFAASTARQYDIYFSTDPESLKSEKLLEKLDPISRTVQITAASLGDTAANNIADLDYYLIVNNGKSDIPIVEVVKATRENRDSLELIGEKIIAAEHEITPHEIDNRELQFASGNFFRITPPEEEDKLYKTIIESAALGSDSSGMTITEGKGPLMFDVGLSQKELEFCAEGDRVEPYSSENSELFYKYGRQINAFVTEKNRYSLASERVQVLIRGRLIPDTTYHYKIIAKNSKEGTSETEIMEFSVTDEPPMCDNEAVSAMLDSTDGRLLITWGGRGADRYELHRYDESDTGQSGGELIRTFGADHNSAILKEGFSTDDVFYISAFDEAEQHAVSQPFGITKTTLSKPEMVEDIKVTDVENDDGKALAVRWGTPKIRLEFNITDPSPEYTETKIPAGYYLIETEDGKKLVHFEAGDSAVPADAVPAYTAYEWVQPEAFDVTVRYRTYTHNGQKVYYAKLKLDDGDFQNDFQEVKTFIFEGLPAGEHTFEAVLLNPAGNPLKNPDASVTQTININAVRTIIPTEPSELVQIWRGNEEIKTKKGVLLKATPNFDPENRGTYELVGMPTISARQHQDLFADSLRDKGKYFYYARVLGPDGAYTDSDIFGPMTPKSQWFHTEKAMVLALAILFVAFVNIFLTAAKKGKEFYLRPIAGISHLDEALGRATEMGRPLLYVLGLTGISDIATIAGLTILGRVAKKAAEFQARLIVPCYNPIVLIVAQETVKTAFMDAGRPDAYKEDDIFYAAGSQFSYAAAVAGLMVRYKTAANFYMGMFYAESLILSETGSMSGSIQIAGTDAITQIPFFITTCDYTLIGEELYAASAYLSQDPMQVGSLKAQDMLKAIYMVVIVIGTVAMTSGFMWFVNLFKVRLEQ